MKLNNIIILLIAQILVSISLPLFRRFLLFVDNESINLKRLYSSLVSSILIVISFIVLALTITHLNTTGNPELSEQFTLFSISSFNFSVGLQLSQIQILLYASFLTALALINFYLSWNKEIWTINQVDRIAIYSAVLILVILSPNFFQLLFFLILLDLILIELLSSFEQRNLKTMNGSIVFGDLLILVSSILLFRRSHSFDFDTILSDIQFKFFIYKPYFIILCCLFLLGIIARSSLFPFHSWLSKVSSEESVWKFNIIMINIVVGISFIFISPISKLLIVVPNYFVWYGVLFSVIATIVGILTTKDKDKQILIFTASIGLLLILLGVGNLASAFQILLLMPVAFLGLMIISSKSTTDDEIPSSEHKGKIIIKLTIDILIFTIVGITIISVIPFSSNLLNIGYLFTTTIINSSIAVYVIVIVSLLGIYLIYMQFSRRYFEQSLHRILRISEIIPLTLIVVFLSLNCILYPIFDLLNPFSLPVDFVQESLPIALIPIFIGWFVILVSYIVIELFIKKVSKSLDQFSEKIQEPLQRIYNLEFIITPIYWIRDKVLTPSIIWFYEYCIRDFFYKIIILGIARFFVLVSKSIRDYIKNVAAPQTINFFKKCSLFVRSLEKAKLRTQLLFIILGLGILLALVIGLYAGGAI